jgi:hypothetical protein
LKRRCSVGVPSDPHDEPQHSPAPAQTVVAECKPEEMSCAVERLKQEARCHEDRHLILCKVGRTFNYVRNAHYSV